MTEQTPVEKLAKWFPWMKRQLTHLNADLHTFTRLDAAREAFDEVALQLKTAIGTRNLYADDRKKARAERDGLRKQLNSAQEGLREVESQSEGRRLRVKDLMRDTRLLREQLAEEKRGHDEITGRQARKLAEQSDLIAGLVQDCQAAENRIQVAAQEHLAEQDRRHAEIQNINWLDVELDWVREQNITQRLSLAHLHDLSKRISATINWARSCPRPAGESS